MNGLRIKREPFKPTVRTTKPEIIAQYKDDDETELITDGCSEFYRFFSCILSQEKVNSYYWLFSGDCIFSFPEY